MLQGGSLVCRTIKYVALGLLLLLIILPTACGKTNEEGPGQKTSGAIAFAEERSQSDIMRDMNDLPLQSRSELAMQRNSMDRYAADIERMKNTFIVKDPGFGFRNACGLAKSLVGIAESMEEHVRTTMLKHFPGNAAADDQIRWLQIQAVEHNNFAQSPECRKAIVG